MNRTALVNCLSLCSIALDDKVQIPVHLCFMFGGAAVTATDGYVAIQAACATGDAFAVNAKLLLGLLTNSEAEDVTFSLTDQDCEVKAGKSRFKLPYQAKEDFILLEPKLKGATLTLTKEIIKGLEACLATASKDATQPALKGITMKRGKTVSFYSSDGDALTRFSTDLKCTPAKDLLIPNNFWEALIKITSEVGVDKHSTLSVSDEWASAQLACGYTVIGQVMPNDNPLDHENVIKTTFKKQPQFVKLPEGLKGALSRAEVVTKFETVKTKLTVENGKLKLLTETHLGAVRDIVGLSGHPDVEADVSAELLQRTLSICDEIAITDRVVAYRSGDTLFQIISNMN